MLELEPVLDGQDHLGVAMMDCGDITTPSDPGGGGSGGAEGPSPSSEGCEALAKAISSTLGAVMREFDSRAASAARSQDDLSLSLDRLTRELDKLLEDAPLPFIMQYATKISSVRKRVSALNLTLKSIQRRIDNIDRMLSSGATTNNLQVTEHRHQQ